MLQPEVAAMQTAVRSAAIHSQGAVVLHDHPAEPTQHLQDGQSRQGSLWLVNCAPQCCQVTVPEGNSRNISRRGPYTFL